MYKILKKRRLSSNMTWLVIEAPLVARKAKPGQFIILRTDEYGERIPLTMAGHDSQAGTIDIIYAAVGRTTKLMDQLEESDCLLDVVGPLGKPTEMEGLKRVAVVGGGTGNALAFPIATGMQKAGIKVDMIAGFKTKDMVILEDEFRAGTENLYITTDDGTYGEKGFTTDKLKVLIEEGNKYDEVHMCHSRRIWYKVSCFTDCLHGGRHRHVRRMQMHSRWRKQICMCGRTGIRRQSRRLG